MSNYTPDQLKELVPFAVTAEQEEMVFDLIKYGGSVAQYAKDSGKASTNVYRSLKRMRARAAKQGHAPEHDMTKTVPDGFAVKGVSTLYDDEGVMRMQWVKTNADKERQFQIMQEAIEEIVHGIKPKPVNPAPGGATSPDLLNLYTMTDTHIGMLAWGKETGKDWDLDIAEATLTGCFKDMVDRAPNADTAVIAQLGDWLHYDSLDPMTPTSGHVLDADSRAGKMVAVACRVLEALVDMALEKHEKVVLLVAEGNHDLYGSLWLRTMFRRLYRDNPRVEIVESENPYYTYEWGATMLAWHHGHKMPPGVSIAQYIAAQNREMWGRTEHCVIHMGDKHHKSVKEFAGATVEQHGTLAANDAYAVRGGWKSNQYAEAITYHHKYGEAGRVRTTPTMIGL